MGTRGGLIVKDSNGQYWPAYIGYDAFEADLTKTLSHYPTEAQALELVMGGDMSGVDVTIEKTDYYARDNGEDLEDVGPRSYATLAEAKTDVRNRGGNNCIMLFEDGKWRSL